MNDILTNKIYLYIEMLYNNITFETVLQFMIVYFFIIWIALIIWVSRDIVNRTSNIFLQILCILVILIGTPFGIFIYLLLRPSKTLFEKYHNEVEENLNTMEDIIHEKNNDYGESLHCFGCALPLLPSFKFCPKCKIQLKNECSGCTKMIYKNWEICPYCGEEQEDFIQSTIIHDKKKKKSEKVHDEILEIVNHIKEVEKKSQKNKNSG